MKCKLLILFSLLLCMFLLLTGCNLAKNNSGEHTIVFDSNGGSEIASIKISENDFESFTLPNPPEREGYVFLGWYIDSELTKEFTKLDPTLPETINLYASWQSITSVGDSEVPIPKFLKMEMAEEDTSSKAKVGKDNGNTRFIDTTTYDYMVNIDKTISIVITIEGNNYDTVVDVLIDDSEYGDNCVYLPTSTLYKIVRQDIKYSSEFEMYVSEIEILCPASQKGGERTITIKKIELLRQIVSSIAFAAQIDEDSDVDLDFQIKDEFSITFDVDGNIVEEESRTFKFNELISFDYTPEKEHYDFLGWFFDPDFTEPYHEETMPNDDLTLYAQFIQTILDITFVGINGEKIVKNVSSGEALSDAPELKFNENEYYKWNFDFSSIFNQDSEIEAVKYASMDLSIDDENSLYLNMYLDDSLLDSEVSVKIYKNNQLLDLELLDGVFKNLESNTEYLVEYLIGDILLKDTIKTYKLAPAVTLSKKSASTNSFEFVVDVVDTDLSMVSSINKVSYYEGSHDNLVATYNDGTIRKIDNLKSNTNYIVEVEYLYNTNDGKGNKTGRSELSINTIKLTPNVEVKEGLASINAVSFDVEVKDDDNAGSVKSIELYLNGELNKTLEDVGLRYFDSLLSNNTYLVKVIYEYDLNDEKGPQVLEVEKEIKTLEITAPTFDIIEIADVTYTEIEVNFSILDLAEVGKVSSIELYLNGELKESKEDLNVRKFEGLLSNTTYLVKAKYEYDLNDGAGVQTIEVEREFTTVEKRLPRFDFSETEDITTTEIGFDFNIEDLDSSGSLKKIELYLGEELKASLEDLTLRKFEELLSNTTYLVKATYEYDLNEGLGVQTIDVEKEFKTNAKALPEVAFSEEESITFDSIEFVLDITDTDEVGKLSKIELYLGEELKATLEDLTLRKFEGLLSNNTYTIKVSYEYDLNDGVGVQTLEVEKEFKTKERKAPSFEKSNVVIDKVSVQYDFAIIDNDDTDCEVSKITYSYTLLGTKYIKEIESEDLTKFALSDLYSNTSYTIAYEYTYDLKDGKDIHTKTYTYSFRTESYTEPNVELKITDVKDGQVTFEIVIVSDVDKLYKTTKIELVNQKDNTDLVSLTDLALRTITIPTESTKYTLNVTYEYDMNVGYVNTKTMSANFNYYFVTFDSDGGSEVPRMNSYEFEHLSALPLPEKDGYVFDGWYSDEYLEVRVYAPTSNTQILEDKTYTAKWLDPKDIFNYDVEDGKVVITGLKEGHDSDVQLVIPNSIDSKQVTEIRGLYINGSSTNTYCTDVFIGANVLIIGDEAFKGFTKLVNVYFSDNSKCTSIGDQAFENDAALKTINLPDSLLSIGENCFKNCTGLVEMRIPKNVSTIGTGMLYGCSKLKYLYLFNSDCSGYEANIFPSLRLMISKIYIPNGSLDGYVAKYANYANLFEVLE